MNLKKFFSEFWEIPEKEINNKTKLNDSDLKNFDSLKFYQFIAAVESEFKIKIEDISTINTFGDLSALI